jgi:hypothetical protein
MWAAEGGHLLCINPLIAAGADVNAKDGVEGGTALIWAARMGGVFCVLRLLHHRADVNAADNNGRNALDHVRQYAGPDPSPTERECIKVLEEALTTDRSDFPSRSRLSRRGRSPSFDQL